ncbi:hypothetical protein DEU56DRAFT_871106 [Suillus clintonianus]|uniref:uncharacterized protein n=1 Tax=Suillus clintonianus TaxID=1904413 RepID=UPI001B86B4C5|nr:uncharacterized protein DEU56DRAFT_871106 [Suillus clintonianus]KAG2139767.1 hypothetical protein DEU56DRAFT_871106 [Suillus clintonianus]
MLEDQASFPADGRDLEYREFQLNDIKVEHHPNSGILTKVEAFGDFKCHPAHHSLWSVPEPDAQPWQPFKSHLEFDVAEIALEAANICHRCARRSEKFTFRNHKDVRAKWDAASQRLTGFTKDVISIPFTDKSWDFDVYYCDLWEWATNLLHDPYLFPNFHFDAQRMSKFNGQLFKQFVDEPFTAQHFWDAQSQLPGEAKPLTFILYVDKTKLSSFGSAKGYPVVARLANLPTNIHNSQGMGGGYIVGWLPVVKEDKQHSGKPAWANFKVTVWQKSFERILSLLAAKSKMGQWLECLDVIQRWFFPLVLILSSDFEEQLTMSLTRGVRSLWPCPVCLVLHDKLSDTLCCYPCCTSQKETAEEREEVLKAYGLHDVLNSFWALSSTDVHRALSWDKLHFHSGGEWSDHLWVELQKHINEAVCPLRYLLLRCVCLYLELDMYASLEVHTSETISSGRHTHCAFSALLQRYIDKTADESNKNWNFPKLHMDVHIFDDPNEKMHGSLKDSYLLCTNFCDVAEQILCINTWQVVADCIHRRLFKFDEHQHQVHNSEEDFLVNVIDCPIISATNVFHVKLGSKQQSQTFDVIEVAHRDDQAFGDFHIKLNDFLNTLLPSLNVPLPSGKHIHLRGTDEITEYCFIHINYKSMVDWCQHTNYLRCSPLFFGSPRFDCVFIRLTENKVILGRLIFCFECQVEDRRFPLALIHPFDSPTGLCLRKDKDLNFFRVRVGPRAQAWFFH